ncbi:MAG: hypothetical protein LW601_04125 [Cryomorphaceae bacterium]|jgi:hypothetical protein|nr:hypothetical protein [Cryomorphaceae bacterium]
MTEPTQPDSLLEAHPSETAYRRLIAYSAACRVLSVADAMPPELRTAILN